MKKIMSLVLALAMMLCSFALADEIGTEYYVSEEPVTLQVAFIEGASCNTRDDCWMLQMWEKYTNAHVSVERISSDAWTERKNLMFAADEQPEILVGGSFTQAELAAYVDAGQIIALDDLYNEYMPHYKEYLSDFAKEERAKLYMDGQMIGLIGNAGDGIGTIPGARAYINQAWLENLGLAMPTTWDEFYDVLVAFRDQDPNGNGEQDEIPLSGYSGYLVDMFVTSDLGISDSWSRMSSWYEGEDGTMEYVFTSDRYYEFLRRMNQLYTEGLLDSEYYTQEGPQMVAKGSEGRIGACAYGAPFTLTNNNPDLYNQYTAFQPLVGEYYSEGRHYHNSLSGANTYFTNKNEHLVESAKWFDFMYTEPHSVIQQGPQKGSEIVGDWNGEGGWYWVDDEETTWAVEIPGDYPGDFEWTNGEIGTFVLRGNASSSDFFRQKQMADGDVQLIAIFDEVWNHIVPCYPQSYNLTVDESDQIALISAELDAYISQMETKFVIGELSLENDWDEFQKHLIDEIGVEEYIEINRAAYARFAEEVEKIPD